ncbi:MAG: amylo-alpha-1,6-glucosidase [Rubrobacteraceae bacterium]
MRAGNVSVASPAAYLVSDGVGDIGLEEEQGLFFEDMRHLSRYVLRVEGNTEATRRRELGFGMREEVSLTNPGREGVEVRVEIECGADFLDVFEVRGYARARDRGEIFQEVEGNRLCFYYRRGDFRRGTVVEVSGERVEAAPDAISARFRVGGGETRTLLVSVRFEEDGEEVGWRESESLYEDAPELEAHDVDLKSSWEQSVEDLASLSLDAGDGLLVPAAGAPWYMALFGRDSLITSHMTLLLGSESAKNTLRTLARHQAKDFDDFTDAEPGKILHEMRRGELAFFGESPETPYYGTADATPLFLILLEEVWRWTGDEELVCEMEESARRCLAWILTHSKKTGNGFIAYETRSSAGLQNQGWKDSDDSMLFQNGTRAEGPIAPCEVQGYVYDALLRTAELSEKAWRDGALAVGLREEAAALKNRFDESFWMEDKKYYALALDGEGRQVDSTTSNAGHLLWSGIVPAKKARYIADRLMGEKLFSGWGIRTMAEGEGGYDPHSYHNGSVWPHDNAIIAEGLNRYGFVEEAGRVAAAILDAAPHFDHRLPEVFSGHSREKGAPVELPRSCSPQAWAAASVPALIRTMLGIEPDLGSRSLKTAPASKDMRLRGVHAFGARHDVR